MNGRNCADDSKRRVRVQRFLYLKLHFCEIFGVYALIIPLSVFEICLAIWKTWETALKCWTFYFLLEN